MTKNPTASELITYFGNLVGTIKNIIFSYDEAGWALASDLEIELYKRADKLKEREQ